MEKPNINVTICIQWKNIDKSNVPINTMSIKSREIHVETSTITELSPSVALELSKIPNLPSLENFDSELLE